MVTPEQLQTQPEVASFDSGQHLLKQQTLIAHEGRLK